MWDAFFKMMGDIYLVFDSYNLPGFSISIMDFAIAMVSIAVAVGIFIKVAPHGVDFQGSALYSSVRNVKHSINSRRRNVKDPIMHRNKASRQAEIDMRKLGQ